LFVVVFLPFIRRALMDDVYNAGGGLMERSEDWKRELVVMRECEVWLQNE
jgi:hypothetical protein